MFGHWPDHFKMEGGLQALPQRCLLEAGGQGWPQVFVEILCRKNRTLYVAEVMSPPASSCTVL